MQYSTENLLQPVSLDEFFCTYFEQRPLLIRRGDASYYSRLFKIDDMLSFLQNENNCYPNVRMVRNGRETPPSEFSATESYKGGRFTFNNVINRERLSRLFLEDGHSVILYQAQTALAPIRQLCDELERDWRVRVHANLYMTPAGGKGFDLHYDTHDVLILQLGGEKRWQIYDRPFCLPYEDELMQNVEQHKSTLTCVFDEVLRQGDLLYIPRGHFHNVTATDVHSLHLTAGLRMQCWRSLFKRAVEALEKEDTMRRSIPLAVWQQGKLSTFKEELRAAVLAEVDGKLDRLLEEYLGRYANGNASAGVHRMAQSFAAMRQPEEPAAQSAAGGAASCPADRGGGGRRDVAEPGPSRAQESL
ncbi:cupin domain-containing protein [Sorangium sp. So ce269]